MKPSGSGYLSRLLALTCYLACKAETFIRYIGVGSQKDILYTGQFPLVNAIPYTGYCYNDSNWCVEPVFAEL